MPTAKLSTKCSEICCWYHKPWRRFIITVLCSQTDLFLFWNSPWHLLTKFLSNARSSSLPWWKSTGSSQIWSIVVYIGYPVGDRPISCEEQILLVTENCEAALRCIRRKRERRSLWIDSICIGQSNIPERSSQVSLMANAFPVAEDAGKWRHESFCQGRSTLIVTPESKRIKNQSTMGIYASSCT